MFTILGYRRNLGHLVRAPIYAYNFIQSCWELRTSARATNVRPFDDPDAVWRQIAEMVPRARSVSIDVGRFWQYFEQVRYGARGYAARPPGLYEKALEHFLAFEFTRVRPGEVFIDVAADKSPVASIARDMYGAEAYQQDLKYPVGVEGQRIGGDASSMPVPDSFADVMVLHCSYEHFEQDADTRLVYEAKRVLKPGGRLCILPLYVMSTYHVSSGMFFSRRGLHIDGDALIYLNRRYPARFGRVYDPTHLDGRVLRHMSGLGVDLLRLVNAHEVHASCYVRFVLLARKNGPARVSSSPPSHDRPALP